MYLKFGKVLLFYSGLVLIGNIATSILFTFLFNGEYNSLIEIPFNLIIVWFAAYYGVRSLNRFEHAEHLLKSPFLCGVTIALVASLINGLLIYFLTGELAFGQGILLLLLSGFAGKSATEGTGKTLSRSQRNIFNIVIGIASFICIVFVSNLLLYKLTSIHVQTSNSTVHYEDKKFGYSFDYPKTWSRHTGPFSQGTVTLQSNKEPNEEVSFWYVEDVKPTNIDELMTYVKEDAKYGEENQGAKTVSILKDTIKGRNVIIWNALQNDGTKSSNYYFADFNFTSDQIINIWVISVNKINNSEDSVVNNIINSFSILN